EAVRPTSQGADLSVQPRGRAVRQARLHVRQDAFQMPAERASYLAEGLESRSLSPVDPLAQLAPSYVDLAAIEHRRERLLEQIRSVQWQVRPLHLDRKSTRLNSSHVKIS